MLQQDSRVRCVTTCDSSESDLAIELQRSPSVALLDAASPRSSALTRQLHTDVTVVIIGLPDIDNQIVEYIEAGAHGYVCLNAALEDVMTSVESALRGELLCSGRVAAALQRRLIAVSPAQKQPGVNPFSLTVRENEVLQLIGGGESNKKIAALLHISPSTVKNHVHNVLEKLGVDTRSKAAAKWRDRMARPTGMSVRRVRESLDEAS